MGRANDIGIGAANKKDRHPEYGESSISESVLDCLLYFFKYHTAQQNNIYLGLLIIKF
jgi:hypothetical protein